MNALARGGEASMKRIQLMTSGNGAAQAFVAQVEVPPFDDKAMPDVVMWGSRAFVIHQLDASGLWIYREAFAFVSLTPSPGLPRAEGQGDE
jgi:hypothetical protein